MKSLFQAAKELQEFLRSRQWRFCFIGGIALQRWGQPRVTVDVDVSLLTGVGGEAQYVDALCDRYKGRIGDVRTFALQNRVLLLETSQGIPLDIALAGFAYEEAVIDRASDFAFLDDVTLRTCSAEDLIVLKAFADRTRDWADIESVLVRQRGNLDTTYVREQLAPLCELKEQPQILDRLDALLNAPQ